jgi:hypothetical protein
MMMELKYRPKKIYMKCENQVIYHLILNYVQRLFEIISDSVRFIFISEKVPGVGFVFSHLLPLNKSSFLFLNHYF